MLLHPFINNILSVYTYTGKSALTGFMESVEPSSATILTSRPDSTTATSLRDQGFNVLGADLDDKQSLHGALEGISAVYIHALSADASKADPKELERARRLISAMESADSVKHVVYNGSAGKGNGYAISQMKQKHLIEDLLMGSKLPSTVLQATLFREEFWKKYTRPGILKGVFSFALPPDKKLQVLSVKDMGKVAAASIAAPEEHIGKSIPLAGDELTPSEMCQLFGKVQGKEVAYRRLPAWPFWFLNRDLYNIMKFYTEVGYDADVAKCRSRYNLQTFEEFLVGTHWADETLDWPKL